MLPSVHYPKGRLSAAMSAWRYPERDQYPLDERQAAFAPARTASFDYVGRRLG
jgi:hypothetical protein